MVISGYIISQKIHKVSVQTQRNFYKNIKESQKGYLEPVSQTISMYWNHYTTVFQRQSGLKNNLKHRKLLGKEKQFSALPYIVFISLRGSLKLQRTWEILEKRALHHLKFYLFQYYKSITGFCPHHFWSRAILFFDVVVVCLFFFLFVHVW